MHKIIYIFKGKASSGFTIVELAAVIIIIGILSSISLISYNSWEKTAVTAQLKSDLNGASSAMENARTFGNAYPTSTPTTFKVSNGVSLAGGGSSDGKSYCIDVSNSRDSTLHFYKDSYTKEPKEGTCAARTLCPIGFIVVPGSSTYSTNDFCVMKFEAKQVGLTNVPISQAAGSPWVDMTQAEAVLYSKNVAGCTNCHLISEAEWMTIAQNVVGVNSNWDDGAGVHQVGVGYLYSGHNDRTPNRSLFVTNVNDGYNDTGNFSGETDITSFNNYIGDTDQMVGNSQRRTLNLSNGETIWDLSGNVNEVTSGTITDGQPGISQAGYRDSEYVDLTENIYKPSVNITPDGTGYVGANLWTSANGIGKIYTNSAQTGVYSIGRSGDWTWGSSGGIFSVAMDYNTDTQHDNRSGFRVTAPIQE